VKINIPFFETNARVEVACVERYVFVFTVLYTIGADCGKPTIIEHLWLSEQGSVSREMYTLQSVSATFRICSSMEFKSGRRPLRIGRE
jgi:hypothetical protein